MIKSLRDWFNDPFDSPLLFFVLLLVTHVFFFTSCVRYSMMIMMMTPLSDLGASRPFCSNPLVSSISMARRLLQGLARWCYIH